MKTQDSKIISIAVAIIITLTFALSMHTSVNAGERKLVEIEKKIADFSELERWTVRGGGLARVVDNPQVSGLELTLGKIKRARMFYLQRRVLPVKFYSGDKIDLRIKSVGDSGCSINLEFKDATGKTFKLTEQKILAGTHTLKWRISNSADAMPYELKKIIFSRKPVAGESKFLLSGLALEAKRTVPQSVSVRAVTGNDLHILQAGTDGKFKLKLTADALKPVSIKFSADITDFYNNTQKIQKEFTLKRNKPQLWSPPVTLAKKGIYWIDYTIADAAESSANRSGRISIATISPAGPNNITPDNGFIFGMCGHPERWGKNEEELEIRAAAVCGAKIFRTGGISWPGIERRKGVWDFSHFDRMVDLIDKYGMQKQYIFHYIPSWAADKRIPNPRNPKSRMTATPKAQDLADFVRKVATRYKGRIRYWEMWNEPDLSWRGTFEDYLAYIKTIYPVLKSVDPNNIVMSGGFAGPLFHPGRKDHFFHAKTVEFGQDYFDIHTNHGHGDFPRFRKGVDVALKGMRKKLKSDKPMYFNETAVTALDGAEVFQAETMFKKVILAMSRGAVGYNWYDLRNDGFNPKHPEHNYGVFTHDFYPKTGFVVYNMLARNITNKRFVKSVKTADGVNAFIFKGENETLIAAWCEQPLKEISLPVYTDASEAQVLDMMDNTTKLPVVHKMVIYKVGHTPTTLILKNETKPARIKEPVLNFVKLPSAFIPKKKTAVTLNACNPLPTAVTLEISAHNNASWKVEPASITLTLAANQSKALKLEVTATESAQENELKIDYSIKGANVYGSIATEPSIAATIGTTREDNPDFILQERKYLENLCEDDPALAHLAWKGVDDLSAKAWFYVSGGDLKLQVRVKDDIHSQDKDGRNILKGDSVVLALQSSTQQQHWEIALARSNDGNDKALTLRRPHTISDPTKAYKLEIKPIEGGLEYNFSIALKALGLTESTLEKGFRLNLTINDNDGQIREGWMTLASNMEKALYVILIK